MLDKGPRGQSSGRGVPGPSLQGAGRDLSPLPIPLPQPPHAQLHVAIDSDEQAGLMSVRFIEAVAD